MSRKEMLKINWKAYMEIFYQHPRMDEPILCLLLSVDFDDESMSLQPLFEDGYIKKDFIANIQHCSIPKKKMKAEFINGKKVKDEKIVPEYEGSFNRINPYIKYENPNKPAS